MALNKTITLGSGKLYAVKATKGSNGTYTVPADMVKDDNVLALIKGGAVLNYTSEEYTAKDDLGLATKTITTSEDVTITSGLMTWNVDTLKKLISTARDADDTSDGKKKILIGGIDNADNSPYAIVFRHEDKGDKRYVQVTMLGTSTGDIALTFAPEQETVLDAEFTAQAGMDNDGTLVILEEGTLV